jgi:acyl CoA:acetate/3-ketoacid CoA transferase beta subunit
LRSAHFFDNGTLAATLGIRKCWKRLAIIKTNVLAFWVPLFLCATGLLVTFTSGLWNIGIEGQIILGAVAASWVALRLNAPAPILIILEILASMAAGALWAALSAVLKTRGKVHEIFSGLALNNIAIILTNYLISGPWQPPEGGSFRGTQPFQDAALLPHFGESRFSPLSLVLAVIAFGAVVVTLRGTIWGWGFSGGMQVDKFGNCNLIGIGPYEKLRVRGPGTVGTLWTASMMKYYLFFWHHNPKVIVDKVDFISSPGFLEGGDSRWKSCRPGTKGPALVYTPLCVLDFEPVTHRLRLRSVNPGYAVEDVVRSTGCEVVVPERVPQTAPPTDLELYLLHSQIDRRRVLANYRLSIG